MPNIQWNISGRNSWMIFLRSFIINIGQAKVQSSWKILSWSNLTHTLWWPNVPSMLIINFPKHWRALISCSMVLNAKFLVKIKLLRWWRATKVQPGRLINSNMQQHTLPHGTLLLRVITPIGNVVQLKSGTDEMSWSIMSIFCCTLTTCLWSVKISSTYLGNRLKSTLR